MSDVQFSWNDISLPVHEAVFHYLGDVDPSLTWNKQDLRSHEKDTDVAATIQQELDRINRYFETADGQRVIQEFLEPVIERFKRLSAGLGVGEEFSDHEFVFVVGPMRTGGTYLLNESLSMLDRDLTDYHYRMISDSLPNPEHAVFWSEPSHYQALIFELAQFLQWVSEVWPAGTVVKKRTCLAQALPVLDHLFGDRARYFLTIRHPAGMAQSTREFFRTYQEEENPLDEGWFQLVNDRTGLSFEDWESMSDDRKVLEYWRCFYRDVGRTDHLEGTLTPVVFGEDSEALVRNLAEQAGVDHDPEPFVPTDREFGSFWESSTVERAIDNVRSVWEQFDREWPELPRR
jgi:hypothetical protein